MRHWATENNPFAFSDLALFILYIFSFAFRVVQVDPGWKATAILLYPWKVAILFSVLDLEIIFIIYLP